MSSTSPLDIELGHDKQSLVGGQASTSKARPLCILSLGLMLIAAGAFAGLWFPKMIHDKMIDASIVCSPTDPDYDGWISNVGGSTPYYNDLYLFHIDNAEDYVKGIDATPEVHEIGPLVTRCYNLKFDVTFVGSTVSYRSYSYCDLEPDNERWCEGCAETDMVTQVKPGYGQILANAFNEGMVFLTAAGATEDMISHVGNTTFLPCDWSSGKPEIPGNPDWSGSGTATGHYNNLVANGYTPTCGACIPEPIDPIITVPLPMCVNKDAPTDMTSPCLAHTADPTACVADTVNSCMYGPAATSAAQIIGLDGYADFGVLKENIRSCSDLASLNGAEGSKTADQLSLLAKFDGGIKTGAKSINVGACINPANPTDMTTPCLANSNKAACDADTVNTCSYAVGSNDLYSAVMVTKTVREFAFGYPSAKVGYFLGAAVLGGAKTLVAQGLPVSDAKVKALSFPATTGYTLPGYTADVAKVCQDKCALHPLFDPLNPATADYLYASTCTGNAAAAKDLDDDVKYLAGINCMPFTATFIANAACAYAGLAAASAGSTPPTCMCGATGTEVGLNLFADAGYKTFKPFADQAMCCIADGMYGTTDLSGQGCLGAIPGFVNERNLFDDVSAATFHNTVPLGDPTPAHTKDNTGCDASKDPGFDVLEYLEYYGKDEYSVYMPTTNTNPNVGFPGTAVPLPTVADLKIFAEETSLNTKVKVSGKDGGTQIQATGLRTRAWASKTFNDGEPSVDSYDVYVTQMKQPATVKAAGTITVKGIELQRYTTEADLFDKGADNEAKGLGVIAGGGVGTYAYGFPVFLSHPNFLNGDDSLLDGVKMYQKYNYETGKSLETPLVMTKTTVEENKEHFSITLDVDPSTGKVFSGHLRLMASLYIMSCDPTNSASPDCALFGNQDLGSATSPYGPFSYYAPSVANVMTPNLKANVMIPTYWLDQWSEIGNDDAESFVKNGELLQIVDGVAILVSFVGVCALLFGIFGLFCGKKK
eukprot:CAMPEP_0197551568 /NCGR_PEP_ID=MMETSP1320-20131121/5075_1 /TAXON_ID=91990 /ORGANISM="Bolidomonas sp., Strain RCC2347" /LENGTH=991 /DNA_ID=CAMNT_0043112085 /DNA_START=13 /DNA_END=2988 /DNA_ORIENTATION=+